MILIIDNYDSFVHNLARYIRELGHKTVVVRNDHISASGCLELSPSGVVISPGPKRPEDAGISMDLLRSIPASTPFLGVCLGHQCLVELFGGVTRRAEYPLHGEASLIRHVKQGIFKNIPSPMRVGRYHSLIADLPAGSELDATAWSKEGELMAVAHREMPWFGVQFHPESLLTEHGHALVNNFLSYCSGRA